MSNIEDDVEILESIVKVHNDFLQGVNKESINEKEIRALEHLLSHYKNMKFNYENLIHDISLIAESLGMQEDSTIEEIAIRISEEMYNQQQINEEHQKLNGELREKVKELEEKNEHLSNTSDYETISLECIHLEEQLEIEKSRIQELEEENAMLRKSNNIAENVNIDNVTEVMNKSYEEFMSNYIPKQAAIEALEDIEDYFERLNGPDEDIDYIRQVKQELLEGEK